MQPTWRLRVCAALTAGLLVAGVTAALVLPGSERGLSGGLAVSSAAGLRPLSGFAVAAPAPPTDGIAGTQAVIDGVRTGAAELRARQASAAAAAAASSRQAAAPRPVVARPAAPRPTVPRPTVAPRPGPAGARLVWPADGELTGWWQEDRSGRAHNGIDIDGDTGDPIWAGAGGVVRIAGQAPSGYSGYGLMVLIDHGEFTTLYAHLSRVDVAVGQVVGGGAPIGLMGATGSAGGSHLHFEVRVDGVPVDPMPYLPPR